LPTPAVLASDRSAPGVPANVLSPVTAPAPPARVPVPDPGPAIPARPTGGQVIEPKLISRPTPQMPSLAKIRGIYGSVKIAATVDKSGNVTNVKMVTGNPLLATAARDVVLQSHYSPGMLNGQPTEVPVEIEVVFKEGAGN
jgi:TonB family protein